MVLVGRSEPGLERSESRELSLDPLALLLLGLQNLADVLVSPATGVRAAMDACDEEMQPIHGMYGTSDAELVVHRTIKRAEPLTFLCLLRKAISPTMVHVENKGIMGAEKNTTLVVRMNRSVGGVTKKEAQRRTDCTTVRHGGKSDTDPRRLGTMEAKGGRAAREKELVLQPVLKQ